MVHALNLKKNIVIETFDKMKDFKFSVFHEEDHGRMS
jgi:hypothetical protein